MSSSARDFGGVEAMARVFSCLPKRAFVPFVTVYGWGSWLLFCVFLVGIPGFASYQFFARRETAWGAGLAIVTIAASAWVIRYAIGFKRLLERRCAARG